MCRHETDDDARGVTLLCHWVAVYWVPLGSGKRLARAALSLLSYLREVAEERDCQDDEKKECMVGYPLDCEPLLPVEKHPPRQE